jgi:hypothetical protein
MTTDLTPRHYRPDGTRVRVGNYPREAANDDLEAAKGHPYVDRCALTYAAAAGRIRAITEPAVVRLYGSDEVVAWIHAYLCELLSR